MVEHQVRMKARRVRLRRGQGEEKRSWNGRGEEWERAKQEE